MQLQQSQQAFSPQTKAIKSPTAPTKRPWHRPTLTFTPIQATAFSSGSPTDGGTGSIN